MSNIITESKNCIKVKLIKVLEGFRGKPEVKLLPDGTDIDTLTEIGEYFIKYATCSSGFPIDLVTTTERANQPGYAGVSAYIKVAPTKTEAAYPTVKVTQTCFFYIIQSQPDNLTGFNNVYIREMYGAEGFGYNWATHYISNSKRVIDCGISVPGNQIFIPNKLYPNTTYKLGHVFSSYSSVETKGLTRLVLTGIEIPDTPYPIEIYFLTNNSFLGISAQQIKGWIGDTNLDADTVYKITITNLIARIEKVTVVE